jgi:hypothetical protein
MKKRTILFVSILITGVLSFTSCTKNGAEGPPGQNGANGTNGTNGTGLYGNITGNVIITNQFGIAVTNDYTAGYIKLVNSTSNAKVDSVVANSSGVYSIDSIPSGTYNMICVYPGYGMSETLNIVMTGGTRPYDIKLAAIPDFNVSTALDSIWNGVIKRDSGYVYIAGTITANDTSARTILVFVGNSSSVSSAPGAYNFVANLTIPPNASTYALTISLNTFYINGLEPNSTAYFAIYGAANNYAYGDYTNYTYGQIVYTAISSSAVTITTPFIVPL